MNEKKVFEIINERKPRRYLEIGIFRCGTLSRVKAMLKVGVDPFPEVAFEGISQMMIQDYARCEWTVIVPQRSDDFFREYSGERFDIVFVDGFHEYEQAMRDIRNGMKVLADGGVVMVHDIVPTNEQMALDRGIGGNWEWTGDVWKCLKELKDAGIQFEFEDIEYGLAVIGKCEIPDISQDERNKIKMLSYDYFKANKNDLLNILTFEQEVEKGNS